MEDRLALTTSPDTDFWQRTHYGFQHDNAPAFLLPVAQPAFSFSFKVAWTPSKQYDQCGLALYQDADNWFKASVEYENDIYSRLGSVVTNLGFSDWATTDVDPGLNSLAYRVSRRGQDFLIEHSQDGTVFKQMRIFHMHRPIQEAHIGIYACSPLDSSFEAVFSDFWLGESTWKD
jgi:regulation of enolase protein 1 (concanavalin A-like superfamily)